MKTRSSLQSVTQQQKKPAPEPIEKTPKKVRAAYLRPSKLDSGERADRIRTIIIALDNIISIDRILYVANNLAQANISMARSSLDEFVRSEKRRLKIENLDAFEHFFFKSVQGRALLSLAVNQEAKFDKLAMRLMNVTNPVREDIIIEGLYFLYHASYIREGYVVRMIEISRGDSSILNVTDTCRDIFMEGARVYVAHGCAIMLDKQIQLIINSGAEDRRCGLGLVVGYDLVFDENKLVQFKGALSGISESLQPFHRQCIALRCEPGDPGTISKTHNKLKEEMKSQTGFFSADARNLHGAAITKLAKFLRKPNLEDMIFEHPEFESGTTEKATQARPTD